MAQQRREPYRRHEPEPEPEPEVGPPPIVIYAVRLMYLRIVLGIASAAVVYGQLGDLKNRIADNNPSYDPDTIDSAVQLAVIVGVIFGALFILIYVLIARQVRKGKNWARVLTWMISGLGVLALVATATQPSSGLSSTVGAISGMADLVLIIMLIMAGRTGWFRKRTE